MKIEPKSIGVGQYQHDVAPRAPGAEPRGRRRLLRQPGGRQPQHRLGATCSPTLRASGPPLRQGHRRASREKGLFRSRRQLLDVARFSAEVLRAGRGLPARARRRHPARQHRRPPRALRAPGGACDPAREAVSPSSSGRARALVREARRARRRRSGAFTFDDIVKELEKPGRDPRDTFVPFSFRDDVHELEDLKPGMVCPGLVTNVTNFGAFVDIGVHQDGLVHISQIGERFVKDPREVVSPGRPRARCGCSRWTSTRSRSRSRCVRRRSGSHGQPLAVAAPGKARGGRGAHAPSVCAARARSQGAPSAERAAPLHGGRRRARERGCVGSTPGRRTAVGRADRPARPERSGDSRRPAGRPSSEPRRPAFNNPFAVLAALKVPPKGEKS